MSGYYLCYHSTWKVSKETRSTCPTSSSLKSPNFCFSRRSGSHFTNKNLSVTIFLINHSKSQHQICSCFLKTCCTDPVTSGMTLLLAGVRTVMPGSTFLKVSMIGCWHNHSSHSFIDTFATSKKLKTSPVAQFCTLDTPLNLSIHDPIKISICLKKESMEMDNKFSSTYTEFGRKKID